MQRRLRDSLSVCLFALVLISSSLVNTLHAQSAGAQAALAVETHPLANHHPQWANPANDAGALSPGQPMDQMFLVLARSPQQEAAFTQFLADQQNHASPSYHHWLTPAEIGERFGPSEDSVAAVTQWLQSQGLRINWTAPSKTFIGFSGTVADVSRAFQTEVHSYRVNGRQLTSIASDPILPAALIQSIKSIRGLYTIEDEPQHHMRVMSSDDPELTFIDGSHLISPVDFNTIYDVSTSGHGQGQTIGIVGRSRTNFADFQNFGQRAGILIPNPTEIVPTALGGVDPGPAYTAPPSGVVDLSDQGEATLDVVRAGSVAPLANLVLVVATDSSGGIGVDAQYLVQTTPVPAGIMNISFGACESQAGSAGVNFWDTLFQQAAAEGISVFVSSGDSGASGCDAFFNFPPFDPLPNSPNYICSSSYATCVGGTEFNDTTNPTQYWSPTNGSELNSALQYIPEGGWNEPLYQNTYPLVEASGGGVSTVIPTPEWQTAPGVPTARAGRYTPDLAFSASGHNAYLSCFAAASASCVGDPNNGNFILSSFYGTSAAAPSMAAITALVDEFHGQPQGNINPQLYAMAASAPSAFHDVTVASSGVTNCQVSTPSMCNNSAPGPTGLTGGQTGYLVTTGYDEVTGLGSLDVANFVASFQGVIVTPTITVRPESSSITSAQPLAISVSVLGPPAHIPTGNVTLTGSGYNSGSTTLDSSGDATFNIPAGTLPLGNDTLTVTYTPDSASSSIYTSNSQSATITVNPPPTFTITGSALTLQPGAATGDTATVTIAPTGGFIGAITLTAAVTASPAGASDIPTVSFGSTGTVNITGTSPGTATLTVTTRASTAHVSSIRPARSNNFPGSFAVTAASLACLIFCISPARLRRWRSALASVLLLILCLGGAIACGGGGGASVNPPHPTDPGTTAGSYTITITGTSGSTTATGAFTLTVQ